MKIAGVREEAIHSARKHTNWKHPDVFALVQDKKGNITYYASENFDKKFRNNEPLVQRLKMFQIRPCNCLH